MYIAPLFAPAELGLFCDRCSYKHSAPTELTRLIAPPRCGIRVHLRLIFCASRSIADEGVRAPSVRRSQTRSSYMLACFSALP